MDSENVIFIIGFIITILSFYMRYFKPGTVYFHQPSTIYLYKIMEHFHLAFPLIVENTGASTHIVDFIAGKITQQNRKKAMNFTASRNLEGFSPPDEEIAPLFTSFSISPRISNTSLISLKSEKELSLKKGDYSFTLTANIDNGDVIIKENFITFRIDEETKNDLDEGNCRFLGYYSVLEDKRMKKTKKKRRRSIQISLLFILGVFSSLAVISTYVQVLKDLRIFGDFSFLAMMLILIAITFVIIIWIKPITAEIIHKKVEIRILKNLEEI